MSIVFSESWGNSSRSKTCQKYVNEYLCIIKDILQKGMDAGEIRKLDTEILATEIYGIACANLYYKKTKDLTVEKLYLFFSHQFL